MVTLVFLEAVMYITVATVLLLIILKKKTKQNNVEYQLWS